MKTVADVMTKDVIAVAPETTIQHAAELMADHGISGLPVVDDDGAVVGILSEGDLILRQRPRPRHSVWRLLFQDGERLAYEYRKAAGTTVAEVMTTTVVSIAADAPLETAALLLDQHSILPHPVMDNGRLAGIVSRGDLVKALAAATPAQPGMLSDAQLVTEMRARMAREAWVSSLVFAVEAKDGMLVLSGLAESEAERSALETMARAIPGCRSVINKTMVRSKLVAQ